MQAGEGDLSEDFANDVQKRDAALVVAITTVTFVILQGDNVGISHVLGDVTSPGRGAHETVAGWFASHASKLPAVYRPSLVP